MSTYNLNDNVAESFEFILGGHTYKMRYPTVEEAESVQKAIKKAQESEDTASILEQVYQFITSDDAQAPKIADILKKQNLKVIKNFNVMIKTELRGE